MSLELSALNINTFYSIFVYKFISKKNRYNEVQIVQTTFGTKCLEVCSTSLHSWAGSLVIHGFALRVIGLLTYRVAVVIIATIAIFFFSIPNVPVYIIQYRIYIFCSVISSQDLTLSPQAMLFFLSFDSTSYFTDEQTPALRGCTACFESHRVFQFISWA